MFQKKQIASSTATATLHVSGYLPLPTRPKSIKYNHYIYTPVNPYEKQDPINLILSIISSVPRVTPGRTYLPSSSVSFTATANVKGTGAVSLPKCPITIFYNNCLYAEKTSHCISNPVNVVLSIAGSAIPKEDFPSIPRRLNPHPIAPATYPNVCISGQISRLNTPPSYPEVFYTATASLSISGYYPLPKHPKNIKYSRYTYTPLDPKAKPDPINLVLSIITSVPGTVPSHTSTRPHVPDDSSVRFTSTADLNVTGEMPLPSIPTTIFYNNCPYTEKPRNPSHSHVNLVLSVVGSAIPKIDFLSSPIQKKKNKGSLNYLLGNTS